MIKAALLCECEGCSGLEPPALQNLIPSFHPGRLGSAQVCVDLLEWNKTSVPRDCIFSLLFRGDLPDTPQTDVIAIITLHKTAQTQQSCLAKAGKVFFLLLPLLKCLLSFRAQRRLYFSKAKPVERM